MATIRRVYIYLVSAISLQSVVWALIFLLRNFLVTGLNPDIPAMAFQIAVVVVGLPIFLAHWLWGQRLANREHEEKEAALRRFYLYATLTGFLAPWIANLYDLVGIILKAESSVARLPRRLSTSDGIIFHLTALIILGVMWFYHQRVLAQDQHTFPDRERNSTIRRLYIFGFTTAGLFATSLAVIHLLRWVMLQFGSPIVSSEFASVILAEEITRLIVGVPLWILFWRWAIRLFEQGGEDEQDSALRKFFLYAAVFISTIGVVANSATILAGVFRRILSLPSQGDIRSPLPIILVAGVVWAYHAVILREDANQTTEVPRQAGIRRLYLYLVAFVGLCALLTGIVGDLTVLLRSFDDGFGPGLREQLAVFSAAILAGLPVWFIPWFRLQAETNQPGVAGSQARQSLVRKLYVYFFLFVGMMAILGSAIFIVFGVLLTLLGEDPPTFIELAQAISYSLIAGGVLAYHSLTLRGDGQASQQARTQTLEALRILVLDTGDGNFGTAVVNALNRENPGLNLTTEVIKSAVEGETMPDDSALFERIAQAGVIVAPWTLTLPNGNGVPPSVAHAIVNSPARKLLAPAALSGWDWAGMDRWNFDQGVQQTLHAVQQILEGEPVKAHRPAGIGTIFATIIVVLFLLSMLMSVIGPLLYGERIRSSLPTWTPTHHPVPIPHPALSPRRSGPAPQPVPGSVGLAASVKNPTNGRRRRISTSKV